MAPVQYARLEMCWAYFGVTDFFWTAPPSAAAGGRLISIKRAFVFVESTSIFVR